MEVVKVRRSASGKTTYENYANNQERLMAGTSRGEGLILPAHFGAVQDGRVFVVNLGTETTPIAFAKTAYDADQPQLVIDVPVGTTIMPLSMKFVAETEAGTLSEVIFSVSQTLTGAGTSTALTPVNARVQVAGTAPSTACSVYSLYTGNGTAPSGGYEFARFSSPFVLSDGDPLSDNRMQWKAADEGWAPMLEGGSSLLVHASATTTQITGYLTVVWWEMDTN